MKRIFSFLLILFSLGYSLSPSELAEQYKNKSLNLPVHYRSIPIKERAGHSTTKEKSKNETIPQNDFQKIEHPEPSQNNKYWEEEAQQRDEIKVENKYLEEDTYFGARYYDSFIGRWISRDPHSGRIILPQSLNRYLYAYNRPLDFTDPDGRLAGWKAKVAAALGKGKLEKDLPIKIFKDFTPKLRTRALLVFVGTLTPDEKESLQDTDDEVKEIEKIDPKERTQKEQDDINKHRKAGLEKLENVLSRATDRANKILSGTKDTSKRHEDDSYNPTTESSKDDIMSVKAFGNASRKDYNQKVNKDKAARKEVAD